MARYVYKHNQYMVEGENIIKKEFEELATWLHNTGIDEDFEIDIHIHRDAATQDYWIHLPELSNSQLFAMNLILSTSELYYQNRFVQFDRPPEPDKDELHGIF